MGRFKGVPRDFRGGLGVYQKRFRGFQEVPRGRRGASGDSGAFQGTSAGSRMSHGVPRDVSGVLGGPRESKVDLW